MATNKGKKIPPELPVQKHFYLQHVTKKNAKTSRIYSLNAISYNELKK